MSKSKLCHCKKPTWKAVREKVNVGFGLIPMTFWQCTDCLGWGKGPKKGQK